MTTLNNIGKRFHTSLELAAYTVTHSEPLEKVAKITDRIIGAAGVVFGELSNSFSNFASQIKSAIIVFESLRFVGVMNLLLNRSPKTGEYFFADPANSWQKCVDRVTLAFHCAFKTIKGLNKFGFVQLGVMAKNAIGKLPIFTLAMDSFILASSFFSTWDSVGNGLPRAAKDLAKANQKIDDWKDRPEAIALLKAEDELTRKHFEARYKAKTIHLDSELDKLEKNFRLNEDTLQKTLELQKQGTQLPKDQEKIIANCKLKSKKLAIDIATVRAKLRKTEGRIEKIANRDCKGLAEDLEKANINFKIKKWEVEKANAKQDRSKIWLRIANAVGKIAVVTFALTLTAINLFTAPFLLSLLLMGTVVDSIGLSKILVEEFWKKKAVPKPMSVISV